MPDLFETLALIRLPAIAGERAARRGAGGHDPENDDARPWGRRSTPARPERPDPRVGRPRRAGSTLGA